MSSKSAMNQMFLNNKFFVHYINLDDDSTTLESDDEILYTVNSNAVMSDRAGQLGTFYTNSNDLWVFKCLSGLLIETGNKSLIKAEMKVFKHFLEM